MTRLVVTVFFSCRKLSVLMQHLHCCQLPNKGYFEMAFAFWQV